MARGRPKSADEHLLDLAMRWLQVRRLRAETLDAWADRIRAAVERPDEAPLAAARALQAVDAALDLLTGELLARLFAIRAREIGERMFTFGPVSCGSAARVEMAALFHLLIRISEADDTAKTARLAARLARRAGWVAIHSAAIAELELMRQWMDCELTAMPESVPTLALPEPALSILRALATDPTRRRGVEALGFDAELSPKTVRHWLAELVRMELVSPPPPGTRQGWGITPAGNRRSRMIPG